MVQAIRREIQRRFMDVVNKDIRMVGVSEEDVEQRVVVVTPKGSRQKKKVL